MSASPCNSLSADELEADSELGLGESVDILSQEARFTPWSKSKTRRREMPASRAEGVEHMSTSDATVVPSTIDVPYQTSMPWEALKSDAVARCEYWSLQALLVVERRPCTVTWTVWLPW